MTDLDSGAAGSESTLALPAVAGPAPALTTRTDAIVVGPPAAPTPTDITCPSCGTVSYFTELGRDAGGFCRECDFPLFWARVGRPQVEQGPGGDAGLRRLPGTAGRVALATIDCPVCTEPNPVAAAICIRCGSELRPAPVVAAPAPPPVVMPAPEPVSPEPAPAIWPWILLAVLAFVGAAVLVVLVSL